jgi:hypothetical protein
MIRRIRKIIWRIRVWNITRQADNRIRDLRRKREKAARQHKNVSAIDAEMKRIRNQGMMI